MYLCKGYMASTLQKLVIPISGYCNFTIPLLKCFIKDSPHKYKHLVDLINSYSLMFHTLLTQKLSFVLITLQITLTFTCGMEFYYHIVQNFDGGNFDVFDAFQQDRQNLTRQIVVKQYSIYRCMGPSIKIFSVKNLQSRYPSKFPLS